MQYADRPPPPKKVTDKQHASEKEKVKYASFFLLKRSKITMLKERRETGFFETKKRC